MIPTIYRESSSLPQYFPVDKYQPSPLLLGTMRQSVSWFSGSLGLLANLIPTLAFPPHSVVTMPALSPTMTAGNIGTWQKKAGDTIAPGDVLVEIETDKAQMDFEFQEDGVLAKILKDSGEKDVTVGNVGWPDRQNIEALTDTSQLPSWSRKGQTLLLSNHLQWRMGAEPRIHQRRHLKRRLPNPQNL